MVTQKSVEKQLKKINFPVSSWGWGRGEIKELPNILMEHEEIFEAVNGLYEGGFSLLVGTNVRILLIDKKPLNFLTVEDLRFDMINEIDYSHRLLGATITVSTGSKTMRFRSYDQQRLRHLINKVQHAMADGKKQQSDHQEDQKTHLEQINQQLQAYLLAQHQQQQELGSQLEKMRQSGNDSDQPDLKADPIRPSGQLADYLFAQSLLKQYQEANQQPKQVEAKQEPKDVQAITEGQVTTPATIEQTAQVASTPAPDKNNMDGAIKTELPVSTQMADLYAEGMQEIFGRRDDSATAKQSTPTAGGSSAQSVGSKTISIQQMANALEINPLKVAYSKLPMALRNRKFGRPSFHAHSQAQQPTEASAH